jgi:hypothetical protein
MEIQATTQKQIKVGSRFITTKTENKTIDLKEFDLLTNKDTLKWFRNLGGSETATKEYTSRCYKITKLVSTSPNKKERTVRTFDFK